MQDRYDMIIMGGGPAGSTLAALVKRKSGLSVLLLESERFPREHIGESLVHACLPVFEEAGALRKILASDCWVQKFGGIFAWDAGRPAVTFFDQPNWLEDRVHRWAIHVDRAEFDKILLDNARDQGAVVLENSKVRSYKPNADRRGGVVELMDGRTFSCRVFVDASGRSSQVATHRPPSFLSEYKNVAIWNHFLNCKPAQTLETDWNIFREEDLSPILCVAFEDGWAWYIPVRKMVNGSRVTTYSIGFVTDPSVLKDPARNYLQPEIFYAQLRKIPLIQELTREAVPLRPELQVVTNYSMIQERFCDFDERWILVGDAAYFVDPLFSSGVTFASGMASSAELLIRTTLGNEDSADLPRMWHDYDREWHDIARSFALAIDQWYHSIAVNHPSSVYWKVRRNTVLDLGIRDASFQGLVDAAITPDLLQILTKGSFDERDLDREGPFVRMLAEFAKTEPSPDSIIEIQPGASCIEGETLAIPAFKASILPPWATAEERRQAAEYWRNLRDNPIPLPSPHDRTIPCLRFVDADGVDRLRQPGDIASARELWERPAQGPQRYGDVKAATPPHLHNLLRKLTVAGLTRVTEQAVTA
jgi:flavin-dependent dehydrogenase